MKQVYTVNTELTVHLSLTALFETGSVHVVAMHMLPMPISMQVTVI